MSDCDFSRFGRSTVDESRTQLRRAAHQCHDSRTGNCTGGDSGDCRRGVGSLLVASEAAFNTIKVLGAGYLIYLGWSQWRARCTIDAQRSTALVAQTSWWRRCMTGFLTNATNPKGIVFMVAVLPQFINQSSRCGCNCC